MQIKISSRFFAVEAAKTMSNGDLQVLCTFAQAKEIAAVNPAVKAVFAASGAYLIVPKGLIG